MRNGKITEIYDKVSEIPSEDPSEIVDYGDKTVIPGMIDCHNHLALDTRLENHLVKMNDCECEQTIRALKTMKDDLVSGVTTSRCLGDRFILMLPVKGTEKEGRIVGPKLVVSGIGMRASHGHGYVECLLMVRKNLGRQARENILHGVDFLEGIYDKSYQCYTIYLSFYESPKS